VRGLENTELRYAYVTIQYTGPEEQFGPDGRRGRRFLAFDVIPITSDGRFTTDPIPPGQYHLYLFAVSASTPEQSTQQSDFDGRLVFTVPPNGDMPRVEVVAKPNTRKDRTPNTDYRVRVVDEAGKPVPKMQAMLHTAGHGYTRWTDGGGGVAGFGGPQMFRDADALNVLVRAEGYAPVVARFEGERRKALQGDATLTLRRGQKVELQFQLPEGLTWPRGVLPEAYFGDFEETVRMMRQPANRRRNGEHEPCLDFNVFLFRELGAARFEVCLAADTPPFHLAIHSPGFLQHFEAGPFTLADVKDGVLAVAVPRPAGLEVRFDPAAKNPADVPFEGVSLEVMRQIHGNTYLDVAREFAATIRHELRLTDLAPGNYLVSVGTRPRPESKPLPGTGINPGGYRDQQSRVLEAGRNERVDLRYAPFDPQAFRGNRTAVLRIRLPDGTPASGRELRVQYQASHYGALTVFTGRVPPSGEVALKGLTDRVPAFCPRGVAYAVQVGEERVGHFGFTTDEPTPEFEFHLAPQAGDRAPDGELVSVTTGKPIRLSSLRGKVVCLEFWATWCGPCQPALAKLNGLIEELNAVGKDRLAIVPVSIDAALDRVKLHILRRGWTRLDHFWTGRGGDVEFEAPAARAFGVFGVPEAILIDRDGRIVWRGHPLGKSEGQDLRSRIEAELKK
jgi:thiol-disulfide isomerase/thioredoxin